MAKRLKKDVITELEELKQEVSRAEGSVEELKSEESGAEDRVRGSDALEEVEVREFKLNVSELLVVDILPGIKQVVVKNLGGGDVYVDQKVVTFTADKCLSPSEETTFKGVEKVFLKAASRPVVRISQFK